MPGGLGFFFRKKLFKRGPPGGYFLQLEFKTEHGQQAGELGEANLISAVILEGLQCRKAYMRGPCQLKLGKLLALSRSC